MYFGNALPVKLSSKCQVILFCQMTSLLKNIYISGKCYCPIHLKTENTVAVAQKNDGRDRKKRRNGKRTRAIKVDFSLLPPFYFSCQIDARECVREIGITHGWPGGKARKRGMKRKLPFSPNKLVNLCEKCQSAHICWYYCTYAYRNEISYLLSIPDRVRLLRIIHSNILRLVFATDTEISQISKLSRKPRERPRFHSSGPFYPRPRRGKEKKF